VAKAALHATYEALLRGAGCSDAADASSTTWFLDVGTDDDELLALASSIGCGVSVMDPEVKDVRQVDMTRCMNEEPNRPFLVFQAPASDVTNPETLANMTAAAHISESSVTAAPSSEASNASSQPPKRSLFSKKRSESLLAKPTMLNRIRKLASLKKNHLDQAAEGAEESAGATNASSATGEVPNATHLAIAEPVIPMESGVMLDTLFTRADAPNASGPVDVTAPSGASVTMNQISVLKVTPRSESAATLKALQGARRLLESGRVQCLVTEMNFDLNHTEAFLNYVVELEHLGYTFAHMGSLDYSELEVTDQGQYEVFQTDSQQLKELFDTYKRIRSFDERSGFRVYSGSLSLDRKGHYFDYTDLIFACKKSFPKNLAVLAKGKHRFQNGVWWIEKMSK
jgi:hypothetical protein